MTSQVNANQELFLDILTKEEKEALLTKKMEEIRKKNEALRKRHEEVEADKRGFNAVSGGSNKPTSPKKESKALPGEETARKVESYTADGRKERPRQQKSAGRGKSPNKGARDAPKAQDIRIIRTLSEEKVKGMRSVEMLDSSDKNSPTTSVHGFQRPDSREYPEHDLQELHDSRKKGFQRPVSKEYENDEGNQRRPPFRGERRNFQQHNGESYQKRGSGDGTYEALKRQHQQLNIQQRNYQTDFRDHDFRHNKRDYRRDKFQRPNFRNGDGRQNSNHSSDSDQSYYNHDNREDSRNKRYGDSEFEPQAKRMQGGFRVSPQKENKGYDFSKSPKGPPPDPAYNFLSDRYRSSEKQGDNKDGARRHPKNYGGEDFSNVKNKMKRERERQDRGRGGPPRNKMEMSINMTGRERRQYAEWKAEREKVDQARVDRQKSASGEWRREWDVQKEEDIGSQRVEPGKRPAGRIGSGRFDRGERDERPLGPGRQDSKESGSKTANGVKAEKPQDQSPPKPRGRGRGRGRARGGNHDPGRVRTSSGDDRKVECKRDLLIIKVDNSPGKKSDGSVEVEYSDGENDHHSGEHPPVQQKKGGPNAEELWWDEEGDEMALELQGIEANDEIFEHKELFDDYGNQHGEGLEYDENGHFEDTPGQTSQGDDDEWEDCTTSEDFYSTDRSQSQTSGTDEPTSPLKVNVHLNPDAPVFTPISPISSSPVSPQDIKNEKDVEKSKKEDEEDILDKNAQFEDADKGEKIVKKSEENFSGGETSNGPGSEDDRQAQMDSSSDVKHSNTQQSQEADKKHKQKSTPHEGENDGLVEVEQQKLLNQLNELSLNSSDPRNEEEHVTSSVPPSTELADQSQTEKHNVASHDDVQENVKEGEDIEDDKSDTPTPDNTA